MAKQTLGEIVQTPVYKGELAEPVWDDNDSAGSYKTFSYQKDDHVLYKGATYRTINNTSLTYYRYASPYEGDLPGGPHNYDWVLIAKKGTTGSVAVQCSDEINSSDKEVPASGNAVKQVCDYAKSKVQGISDAVDSDSSETGASSKAAGSAFLEACGDNFPPGSVLPFSGTFGGTDNRYPIPVGSTEPDTSWCICDGVTTDGVEVPDLRGSFIRCNYYSAYTYLSTGYHYVRPTDDTTLTEEQTPAHTHTAYTDVTELTYTPDDSGTELVAMTTDGYTEIAPTYSVDTAHSHSWGANVEDRHIPLCYAFAFIMKIK